LCAFIQTAGHCNAARRFDPDKTEAEQRQDHRLFRTYEVLHRHVSEFIAPIIAGLLGVSCLTQILSFYTLVKLSTPAAFKIVVTAAAILTCVITKICIDFAIVYTSASKEFPASLREWSRRLVEHVGVGPAAGAGGRLKLYQHECRRFRTYRPLKFKIGDFCYISETTYVALMSDFILSNLVTLLALKT
jgi:hypothetical protein